MVEKGVASSASTCAHPSKLTPTYPYTIHIERDSMLRIASNLAEISINN